MTTTTTTRTTATAVDALVDFAQHLAQLADAGQAEMATGNRATAEALLDAIEAETSALADSLGAALGIEVDGFGGVSDLLHGLVSALVPGVSGLAALIDDGDDD